MSGIPAQNIAASMCIHRQTLTRWIRRFDEEGIDGLIDRPRAGRPRKISEDQTGHYRELIEHPEMAGHAHWTARKFHGHLREEFQHEVGYRTVVRWLHEQGYRLKVPQPWPDRQDEKQREAFVEWVRGQLGDDQVELWYGDEMGVEGDPRPRRRWIEKGKKGRVTKNGDHLRMNVMGTICPRTGEFFAIEISHSDRDCFQVFLDETNKAVSFERPTNYLILDNASWHRCATLDWGSFTPVYLPAYSPDLNPIEKLWLIIKAEWFTDYVSKTEEILMDRLDQALLWAFDRIDGNQRTCAIKTEL